MSPGLLQLTLRHIRWTRLLSGSRWQDHITPVSHTLSSRNVQHGLSSFWRYKVYADIREVFPNFYENFRQLMSSYVIRLFVRNTKNSYTVT